MLVPDLNRGTNAVMGPRGRQRSPGRHWEKTWDQSRPHESHWERSWNQPSSFGNSREKTHGNPTETPREDDKLTLEQPAQGIDERIRKDSKLTELKTEPTQEQKTPPCFDSQELMKMIMKEFFQRKRKIGNGKRKRNQIQPD